MDKLTFVIELTKSLTWPLTALIVVFSLKKPIRELIPFLKKAKISELELEFDRELEVAAIDAQQEFNDVFCDWRITLTNLVEQLPSSAVIEAWKEVEAKTRLLIKTVDPEIVFYNETRYKDMQEIMEKKALINQGKIKVFNDLRLIRNKVTHAKNYTVSASQARSYVNIAIPFIEYLDSRLKEFG